MQYIEIAKGSVANRGIIIPKTDLIKHVNDKEELFRSYFSFDEEIKLHIASGKKTPLTFGGKFYLDYLIFDIDKGDNSTNFTILRLKEFVKKLEDDWRLNNSHFTVWFSGRGFHIHTCDFFGFEPSNKLPLEVKNTIDEHFPEADTKPINPRGLIRVGHTKNLKSGFYKIPIPYDDLWFLSQEYLDTRAISQCLHVTGAFDPFPRSKLYSSAIVKRETAPEKLELPSLNPTNIVTCMQECYKLGEEIGTRHERILRLVSWQRRNGTPIKANLAMMKDYAPSMDEQEITKIVVDSYKANNGDGYNYQCIDKVMSQFCRSNCIFFAKKNYTPHVISNSELEKEYHRYAVDGPADTAIFLNKVWDMPDEFIVNPGDLVVLIGNTGRNKTSLLQNLILELKLPTLWLSTEFGRLMLYRRFAQIAHNMTSKEVAEHYRKEQNSLGSAFNFISYLKTTPNIDELEKLISTYDKNIVVIDVLNDIPVKGYQEGVSKDEILAKRLKVMAETYHKMIFCVQHISKSASQHIDKDGNVKELPMTVHSGKGGSGFEQKADSVFAVEGADNSEIRTFRTLKARDNAPFKIIFGVNVDTFKMEQIKFIDPTAEIKIEEKTN